MAASSSLPPPDQHAWKQLLPIGIRFRPTYQELIFYYLNVKVGGRDISPTGIIGEAAAYSNQPDKLPYVGGIQHDDGRTYFFTYIEGKDNSKKKSKRLVLENGSVRGYWKATQGRKDVRSGKGNTSPAIGTTTSLAYHYLFDQDENGIRKSVKTNWLVTECRLPEDRWAKNEEKELVLCVVYYNEKSRRE